MSCKAGRKPYTESYVRKYLKLHYPTLSLIEYSGYGAVPSVFKCKKCKEIFKKSFSTLKNKLGRCCPGCYRRELLKQRNHIIRDIKDWLRKNNPHITLVEYVNSTGLSLFCCSKCGMFFGQRAYIIKHGADCPHCCGRRVDEPKAVEWFKEHRPDIKLVKWGGGCHKYSLFECNKCGNIWQARYSAVKYGSGCPKCAHKKIGEITESK